MARKFWERINTDLIRYYGDPSDQSREDIETQIAQLEGILALPDDLKAVVAANMPHIETEEQFTAHFTDQIHRLADVLDYFDYDTIEETVQVFDHTWLSPSALAWGSATVLERSGEEPTDPASNAINGDPSQQWRDQTNHPHYLIIDLGYPKRIDGIQFSKTGNPPDPTNLFGVDVRIAQAQAALQRPESLAGEGLTFDQPGDDAQDLTPRTGRYVRIDIATTGAGNNSLTVRDIAFRVRARTFDL